ncbi:hypothetical protein O1611_g2394 [Lasiodiplodia mahajangana]|uniref:Uncharacterized protein n=1 Tax=Lasiodiplodia mahajangana TaxID=1108764 RepID=A0ACC2JUR7_9PEZI|nr:hypothetical protein O1611_g2394 [Lasiodiplodia mahajangana]
MPSSSIPSTLPWPSADPSTWEVVHLVYPRSLDDPPSDDDDDDPYDTQDSISESGGEPSGAVHEEEDAGDGDKRLLQIPRSESTEHSEKEVTKERSGDKDEDAQEGDYSGSEECSDDVEFEDVPIGLSDESTLQIKVYGTRDDLAEDDEPPKVPEPKPIAALSDFSQHAEEPLGNHQLASPSLDDGGNDIGTKYSLCHWGLNSLNDQMMDVDWEGLHRDPGVRTQIRTARMLIHPKSSDLRVVPRGDPGHYERWIRVDGPLTTAQVLVVESGPKQFGCTMINGHAIGHFMFDTEADNIFFETVSARYQFSFRPLKGNEEHPSQILRPYVHADIDRGTWALAIDGTPVMEFKILRRMACRIRCEVPSKRVAPTDERPTKRRKVFSNTHELVLTSGSCGKQIGNPIFSLREGQKLVCQGFGLRRHETIFENANTLVWRGEYRVSKESWEDCVVKTIKCGGQRTADTVELWKRECDILQAVQCHVNIVRILKADIRLNSLFLEPVIGAKALSNFVNPNTTFTGTLEDAQRIMRHIAAALAQVHAKGFAHGDVKPSNILYGLQRIAVLIDFGLAFPLCLPRPGGGTPWYIPPEFKRNWRLRGPAGDVWAFAITAGWLIGYLQLPEKTWKSWNIADLHEDVRTQEYREAASEMNGWLEHVKRIRSILRTTDPLENIISRGLDPNRRTRITAAKICEELDRLCLTDE